MRLSPFALAAVDAQRRSLGRPVCLPPRPARPTVLINPGAGWGAKRWPVERYAAVAQDLIARGCACWSMPVPAKSRSPTFIVKATLGAATPLAPARLKS